MISSGWFLFHEVVEIKHYLEKKSYPLSLVGKQVKFFLENKINEKSETVNATNNVVEYLNYLILAIFQQMSNVKQIRFVYKYYCKGLGAMAILILPRLLEI